MDDKEQMMDSAEAQLFLGVKRAMLFRLIHDFNVQGFTRLGSKRTFYKIEDLERIKAAMSEYKPRGPKPKQKPQEPENPKTKAA